MQPEIDKTPLVAPREVLRMDKLSNKFHLANMPDISVELKIDEKISLYTTDDDLIAKIIKANTFVNPKYESNEQHGYSNWQTDPTIETYRYEGKNIILPRGYMRELLQLLREHNVSPEIIDNRISHACRYPDKLHGIELRHYQQRAVASAMQYDQGCIVSPTGSGKTLIALEVIRKRGQKALVIIHRSDLAKQWIDVIKERLGLKAGYIGDGEWEIGNEITIGMVQTLAARKEETKALSNVFGLILCEEMHHAPAATFFDVLGLLAAKFRYGISATPNRRDGLEQMIYRVIGPIIASIDREEVEDMRSIVPTTVLSIKTGFSPGYCSSWVEYQDALSENAERNIFLINLALAQQTAGAVLVLVDRIVHAENLSEMLKIRNIDHALAHGKIGKKDREAVLEKIKSSKITIGTTGLLGEGIDISTWSILILASPISSEIKLLQAVGRIVRPAIGKKNALVFDLKDDCGFAGSSFKKRLAIYQKNNIEVQFCR